MENIALPRKIDFKKGDKPNHGFVIIEPFYPGYGMTIGNSLRRVLLSSLPGAAIVGVKIKGVDHEFTTWPHVKEDILEIILNLKKLRLKIFSDEEVKLELDVHGKKKVKASDIIKNSQVEIVNPDLDLANITDMAGSLNMKIFADKGRGYRPVENIEDKKNELGYIEMDSIFSPVLSVGIKVENVRVGKMTNWDKLILDIVTDGTITPEEAFKESVKILIDQFGALIGKTTDDRKHPPAFASEALPARNAFVADGRAGTTEIAEKKNLEGKIKDVDKVAEDDKEEKKEEDVKEEIKAEDEKIKETGEAAEDKPKKKRGRPKKVNNEK